MGYVFRCGQGNLSSALVFMKTFSKPRLGDHGDTWCSRRQLWTRIGGIFRLNIAAKLNDKVFLSNVILENLASRLDGLVGDSSVIPAKKCSAPTKLTD